MKKIHYSLFCSIIVFGFCSDALAQRNVIKYNDEIWKGITAQVPPTPSMLPNIYDIEEIGKHGKYIWIKNRIKEPKFALIDPVQIREVAAWGYIGQGPREFLKTAMWVEGEDEYIRIYDNYKMHKFILHNDSLHYIGKTQCNNEPDFLQTIHAINDSIVCGYKYAPREIGIHLLNIISQQSFDAIRVNEGYFTNKETPYELSMTVFNDKVIVGRKKFNQIEIYKINHKDRTLKEEFIINYNNASVQKINKEEACYLININANEKHFYMLNQDTDQPGQKTYVDIYTWSGKPVKRIILDDLYLQGTLIGDTMYLKKCSDDDNLYLLIL